MRRIFSPLFISIVFLVIPFGVHAQSVEKWTPVCLDKVTHCGGGAPNENCQPIDDAVHQSSHWGHRAQIDVRSVNIPPDQDVIFVECIKPWPDVDLNQDGQSDWFCTTGDAQTDYELFCGANPNADKNACNMAAKLNSTPEVNYGLANYVVKLPDGSQGALDATYEYYYRSSADLSDGEQFQILNSTNRLRVDSAGKLNASYLEAQSFSVLGHRKYLLFYTSKGAAQVAPTVPAGVGGQQQATLGFEEVREIVSDTCSFTNVGWDPYGRVFDAVSLEPIPQVSVQLLQMNPQGQFDAGYANTRNRLIINPFATSASGMFIFYVEDGDYHLRPSLSGYTMPLTGDWTADTAARSIYSDIYFADSPAIQQRGAIQHRDIPMIPVDNTGKSYPLEVLSRESTTDARGNLVLSGVVSHPFAEAVVETCRNNNGVEVCANLQTFTSTQGGPNKDGEYTIILPQSELKPGEYYKESFRKVDLKTRTVTDTTLYETTPVQPVPAYIEGYAYDRDGNLLSGGFAGIYPISYPVPVEMVPIDESGYIKITSERIPKQPYTIKYLREENGNYVVISELTISDFVTQNIDFLTAEEIALYSPVTGLTNPRRNVTPAFQPMAKVSPVAQNSSPLPAPADPATNETTEQRNPILLVGAIILLLIGGAGALLGFYIYKKRASEGM